MKYLFDQYELDLAQHVLSRDGVGITIEPQVFEVLATLVSRSDQLVTKQDLIDLVWGGRFVSDSALSSRIKSARQAIDDDGKRQRLIRTIHGRGFRFVGEVQEQQQTTTPAVGKRDSLPTVAVLPFDNLSAGF